jgi:type I restriction enzyme M protein
VLPPGKPRSERVESERFKAFTYDELVARDKTNLDITWLRDKSLDDFDNLPKPDVIAREIGPRPRSWCMREPRVIPSVF